MAGHERLALKSGVRCEVSHPNMWAMGGWDPATLPTVFHVDNICTRT